MPDLDDPNRPPRKGKEPMPPGQPQQNAKHVHFDTNGTGKQYPPPPQATSAPNSPAPSKAQSPPSLSSNSQQEKATPPYDNQPTSFPQVGAPPGQFGPGQWYTSADPRMSLSQQQQQQYQQLPPNGGFGGGGGFWQQAGGVHLFANGAPAGAHFYPAIVPPHYAAFNNICHPVFHTLVHHHHYHHPHVHFPPASVPPSSLLPPPPPNVHRHHRLPCHYKTSAADLAAGTTVSASAAQDDIMANYQNAGPPNCGVNFQPPVPDTTFGPIPHVYVPRFDAAYASAPSGTPQPAYGAVPMGQPGFVVAQQPAMMPQPIATLQPVFLAGQPGIMQAAPGGQVIGGGGGGGGPGIPVIAAQQVYY